MPNLRGLGEAKRHLYANVVLSVILYAAPIWSDALKASLKSQRVLNRVLRTVAIRVIAAYRIVSLDAALVLARILPLTLIADERLRIFERIAALRMEGAYDRKCLSEIREQERDRTLEDWSGYLVSPGLAGIRTIAAIRPQLKEWVNRRSGGLTFRLTQMLTGHGCFGSYLARIQRVSRSTCLACDSGADDIPEHTLSRCSRWRAEREQLVGKIGRTRPLRRLVPPSIDVPCVGLAALDDPVLAVGPGDAGRIAGVGLDPDLVDPAQ